MAILNAGIVAPTGGYQISRSLRFNSADSAYLNRTPASAGNRRTWTWSGWVKKAFVNSNGMLFAAGSGSLNEIMLDFTAGGYEDQLRIVQFTSSSLQAQQITTAKFRDPSAWYHVVFSIDTTQATAANRWRIYVNGVEQTSWAVNTQPSQNLDTWVNSANSHLIGSRLGGSVYLNGYLTEINFIDGQALTPSSFGETDTDTGVWKPKKYTGTYGTNGFYLNFSDNSGTTSTTLGKDSSGNGNNWTPNNFSVTAGAGNDSLVDTPTPYGTDTGVGGEVRSNYATLNPLSLSGTPTLSNGNLDIAYTGSAGNYGAIGTLGVSSGKWYFETTLGSDSTFYVRAGFLPTDSPQKTDINFTLNANFVAGSDVDALDLRRGTGSGSTSINLSSTTPANGGVIGVSFDIDAGEMRFYYNGTELNVAITSGIVTGKTWVPFVGLFVNDGMSVNFGQRPFAYTAPSGFKALCTQNLPDPTIADGGEYFNTVLYTGNGSTQTVTGLDYQPDLVYIKSRSDVDGGRMFDVLRGVQQAIFTNSTAAETTVSTELTAFNSNGFSLGNSTAVNENTQTYVAWNWKANGAGVSNTAGTISSTVSVNTTSGFSIVKYTATGTAGTVGHGLGVVPQMIIVKHAGQAGTIWPVYTAVVGNTKYLRLNATNAETTDSNSWNNTTPTSTVFSVGNNGADTNNTSGGTTIAYCFAPVAGYSAMSSFTGNGSADGPFIFTNHRPAFVLIKRTDTTSNWTILDFQREGYNVDNDPLYPNLSDAEGTTDLADLLSNGFKLRTTDASVNASGGTYIYMSLASNPFKYSLGR